MAKMGRRDCRTGQRKKASGSVQREEVIKSIRKARKAAEATAGPSGVVVPVNGVVRGVGGSSHPARIAATEAELEGKFADPTSTPATLSYLEQMRTEVGAFAADTRKKYDQSSAASKKKTSK